MTRRTVRVDAQFFADLDAQLPEVGQLVADGSIVLFGLDIDLG